MRREQVLLLLVVVGLAAGAWQAAPTQPKSTEPAAEDRDSQQKPDVAPQKSLVLIYDQIPTRSGQRQMLEVGATQYLIVYQGTDPQAKGGRINSDLVIQDIERRAVKSLPRFGILDFEDPYAEILQKGASDPRWQDTISNMVAVIRLVRTRFPNTLWTYYGVPFVPFWINGTDWESATPENRKAELEKLYQANAMLVSELDWVNCSIYPVYDPTLFNPAKPELVRAQGRAWRRTSVSLSRILANGKPVIPMVSPYWQPNGVARAGFPVPKDQFIEDQVAVAVDGGAVGIAVWTGIDTFIDLAIRGEPQDSTPSSEFSAKGWREVFTTEFLSGVEPSVWSDPSVRAVVEAKAACQIGDAIRWIRDWESAGSKPVGAVKD